jgi:hypothetical protein
VPEQFSLNPTIQFSAIIEEIEEIFTVVVPAYKI